MNFLASRLKATTTFGRISRLYYHNTSYLASYPSLIASQPFASLGRKQRHRLLSSSSKADKSKQAVSSPKINERGGIWIYIGWTLLGLVVVDLALQYKQDQEDNERRRILSQMQLDADNASVNIADWDESLPTLFTCKILHVDPGLDGTKMLTRSKIYRGGSRTGINRNIKRGDLVEVIEAGVGPSQSYHLCRMKEPKSDGDEKSEVIGWYPIEYLERLD